jgi:hypothetical protein
MQHMLDASPDFRMFAENHDRHFAQHWRNLLGREKV